MELIEIVRKYYPKCEVKLAATKLNEGLIEPRYFINGLAGKNKGSFSIGGIKNEIRRIKIYKIVDLLGVNVNYSKVSNSVYFKYKGVDVRISDHPSKQDFLGFDYIVHLDTNESELSEKIKNLVILQ